MNRATLLLTFLLSGCIATSFKSDLKRPDFSEKISSGVTQDPEIAALSTSEQVAVANIKLDSLIIVEDQVAVLRSELVAEISSLLNTK